MATDTVTVKFRIKLPWWWKIYLHAVAFSHVCGVIDADPKIVADFLMRHTKIDEIRVRG